MDFKNKRQIAWMVCIAATLLLVILFAWVFRSQISTIFSSSEKITAEVSSGVPRKTSYLGRIREAEDLLSRGMNSRAAIELSVAISEKPEILRPYILLGEAHLRAKNFTKLRTLIAELDNRFPDNPEIVVLQARMLIAQEDFRAAQILLKDTDAELLDTGMQFYQAALSGLQNDHQGAQEQLIKLSRLPVKESLVIGESGVEEISTTEALSPALSEKVEALKNVYLTFEQFADGEDPHLFALLSKALAENSEPTLARAFANISIREDISYVDAWMLRGYSNFLLENNDLALEDLRHAYKLDPVRPEVEYFLALALERAGQKTEASLFYEKLLTRDFPYKTEVRWKLISLLTAQKDMERVVDLYKEQAEENTSPAKFVSAVHTLLNVLKQPEEALELTQTLLSQQPENVLTINLRAWALIESQQYSEAKALLKKAEQLDPSNPRTQLNFGLLAEKQDDLASAKEYYKKCYDLGQDQPYNSVVELAVARYNELVAKDIDAKRDVPVGAP